MQDILNNFIRNHIASIAADYRWRVNPELLPAGVHLDPGGNYHQNIQLKHQLSQLFNDGDPVLRQEIITYYIAKWGGVKTNAPATIQRYATTDCEELIDLQATKGIASWSKALCVRDPKKYAIFDARVSATLNLLLLAHPDHKEMRFFPRLPSRNQTIVEINRQVKEAGVHYINKHSVYRDYLQLIQNAATDVGTDIQTVEMILFSHPEKLWEAR
jgi:hypothetical protein